MEASFLVWMRTMKTYLIVQSNGQSARESRPPHFIYLHLTPQLHCMSVWHTKSACCTATGICMTPAMSSIAPPNLSLRRLKLATGAPIEIFTVGVPFSGAPGPRKGGPNGCDTWPMREDGRNLSLCGT